MACLRKPSVEPEQNGRDQGASLWIIEPAIQQSGPERPEKGRGPISSRLAGSSRLVCVQSAGASSTHPCRACVRCMSGALSVRSCGGWFTHQAKADAMRKHDGTQLGTRISTSAGPDIQKSRAGGAYPI